MKRIFLVVAIVIVAVVMLLTLREFKQEEEVLRVGCVLPLTGELAKYGSDARNGILLAKSEVAASGRRISIFIENGKADPKTSIAAYQQLKATKDINVLVTMISGITKSLAPIASQDGVFHFATVAAAPRVFSHDDPAFRWYYTGNILANAMSDCLAPNASNRTIAIVYESIDYSMGTKKLLEQDLQAAGAAVSGFEYSKNQQDYRSLAAKVLHADPDLIVLLSSGGVSLTRVVQALRENGYDGKFVSDDSISFPDVLKVLGQTVENTVFFASEFDGSDTSLPFVQAYHEQYETKPSDISAFAYDMIRILSDYDGPANADALNSYMASLGNYPSVLGSVSSMPSKKQLSVPIGAKLIQWDDEEQRVRFTQFKRSENVFEKIP